MDLKVLTLNCWGIKFISKNREERMRAIAEELATGKYDVVSLQEIWLDSDFNLIKEKVSGALPHAHYFYSGVAGSGVCVLSRYPIQDVFFHQWSINGYIHKIHHGDWFGGKGVGLCQLKVNDYIVNVYSAHLHAEYNSACDEYLVHRVLQAFNTAQFIKHTSAQADIVILAGDLNTEPSNLAYRIITTVAGLYDSFREVDQVPDNKVATNESLENTYTSSSRVEKNTPGLRIDYVMYHPGKNLAVKVNKYDLPLSNLVPDHNFSYSDHEAVCVSLNVSKKTDESNEKPCAPCESEAKVLEESMDVCTQGLKHLRNHQTVYLIMAFVFFCVLILTLCLGVSYGYQTLYFIFKSCLIVLMLYCLLMGTLWNCIEKHAIMATINAIEVSLKIRGKVNKDL